MFNVTYEIVTPESAEDSDCEESGFLAENVSLRDAIELVGGTRTNRVDGVMCVESDSHPMHGRVRWVSVVNGTEFETGAQETRALHIPSTVSAASSRRIARLLGVR